MTTTTADITALRTAIETRDAAGVLAWYAPDAVLRIVDRDHPPSTPTLYRGIEEIGTYYRDLCGRNIDHELHDVVVTSDGLAFAQHCRYPDGARVLCITVATLDHGKITNQTAVQAWDA
jgi:ketosteroid isomerase-like protein